MSNFNEKLTVKFKKSHEKIKTPILATHGSACYDLYSENDQALTHGVPTVIDTGISIEIPKGYEALIRPRSSISYRGVIILNSPGTIDSDYRGEVRVIMLNLMCQPYFISSGDRICQISFQKVLQVSFKETETLSVTKRGRGGFGSTGK